MGIHSNSQLRMNSILISLALAPLVVADVWEDAGIVPTFLPNSPYRGMGLRWAESGRRVKTNQTVDTGDILYSPDIRFKTFKNMYTIMIVDFGVDNGGMNYIHWMVTNVPGSRTDEGDERFDYLPPWGFERNATNTGIIDTGDAAVHQVAVLAFKQPGTIDVTESARGCPESIFNRFISLTDFMAKYGLEGPAAGNMFWTKYGTWADEMNCYATSCSGAPFPFDIPGLTDAPQCQFGATNTISDIIG